MEKTIEDSLRIWELYGDTDPKFTKDLPHMPGMTAIDPHYQTQLATMSFGPIGYYWGIIEENYELIPKEDPKICLYTAILYYPGNYPDIPLEDKSYGKIPIQSDIQLYYTNGRYNSDWAKKLVTDALTKGLSRLGFNHDVFLNKFDGNKYVEDVPQLTSSTRRIDEI